MVHESLVLNIDDCRVRGEFGFLFGLPEYGQRDDGASRDGAAWAGSRGPLFCIAGAVAGVAYGSLSRPLWLDVAVWVAFGADVFGIGALSPAAVGGGVRFAIYYCVFFGGA